jgi:hypothetical protein
MAPLEKRPAPIRALVVDDESLARRNLTVLLRRDPERKPSSSEEAGARATGARIRLANLPEMCRQ